MSEEKSPKSDAETGIYCACRAHPGCHQLVQPGWNVCPNCRCPLNDSQRKASSSRLPAQKGSVTAPSFSVMVKGLADRLDAVPLSRAKRLASKGRLAIQRVEDVSLPEAVRGEAAASLVTWQDEALEIITRWNV